MIVGVLKDVLCRINEVSSFVPVPGDDVPGPIDEFEVKVVVPYSSDVGVALWVIRVLVVVRFSLDVGGECIFQPRGDLVERVYKVPTIVGCELDLDLIQVGR